MAKQENGEEVEDEVITAVYKLNLHCDQCAREVKKPLIRTQGVHTVNIDSEIGEIKVKGTIDPLKIKELIERKSKKKVELVSPMPKIKKVEEKKHEEKKEDKEPIYSSTTMKVHMHCEQCEFDLTRKLLKLEGVHNVHTDIKAQTLKVNGTIEPEKIVKFIHKNLHKQAEIISTEKEVKEKKKEKMKEVDDKVIEPTKAIKEQKIEEVKEQRIAEVRDVDVQLVESTGYKNGWEDQKKMIVELRIQKENVPYIVHHVYGPQLYNYENPVYAPQLFSDENPDACTIM